MSGFDKEYCLNTTLFIREIIAKSYTLSNLILQPTFSEKEATLINRFVNFKSFVHVEGRKCAWKAYCLTDETKINHVSSHRIPNSQQSFYSTGIGVSKTITWKLKLQALDKSVNRLDSFETKGRLSRNILID